MRKHGYCILATTLAVALQTLSLPLSLVPNQTPRKAQGKVQGAMGSVLISINDTEVDPRVFSELQILLDGTAPMKDSITVLPEEKQIFIRNIPAGECRLVAAHHLVAKDPIRVRIQPGQQTLCTLTLRRAVVRLTVVCEPGAKVYLDGAYRAEVPPSGRTGILEFPPGEATLRVIHSDFLPKEFRDRFLAGDQEVEMRLERAVFSDEFSDGFGEGVRFWNAPTTWRVENKHLRITGREVGLLRERIYKNFRAQFLLSLENQRGAAWMVRALDESNGYLFQLTGPAGNPPNLLRSFLRQEGNLRLLKSDPVIDDLSQPRSTLEVHIDATDGTIKHLLKTGRDGREAEPISVLTDQTFRTGTLGFTTIDSEEFNVYFVSVLPRN